VLCAISFWYCKIFSWVRRSTLQLGAQGGERKRENKRIYYSQEWKLELCSSILIYHKAQLCGRSPRERVNHVYVVLCVFDVVFFVFGYVFILILC
jgi:hypothetical protein